jgi:hypothetical protein
MSQMILLEVLSIALHFTTSSGGLAIGRQRFGNYLRPKDATRRLAPGLIAARVLLEWGLNRIHLFVAVIGRSHSSRMLQSHFFEGDRSNSDGFEM